MASAEFSKFAGILSASLSQHHLSGFEIARHYRITKPAEVMEPAELSQILKADAVKVLHSICQQIWKTQHWPQEWKRSVFIPIPKKGNAKEGSN